MKLRYLAAALVLTLCAFTLPPQNKQALPNLTIKDVNGNPVNVADYGKSGKITVISFWATWCSPCIKELRNINELLPDWQKDYGVQLVAVSIDNSKNVLKVKPFVDGQGWKFDVLLDTNEDLKRALNVTNPPVTFLVDKQGNIVYTHTGYIEGDEYELEKKIKEIK
jgi:cytochrome c biogenesis protein CcmG, thiol:disulfide interchange protein DsbE